ncbi:MAG: S1 RNA-binding domain-containing protein [Clostridia bacterium]|nr:S1 RNA-binding domain-containing protein [Clostridia bacterium]
MEKKQRKTNVKKKFSIEDLKEAWNKKQVFDIYVEDVDGEFNLHCVFADGIHGIMPREEVSSVVEDDGLVSSELCLKRKGKIMQACIKDMSLVEDKIDKVILSKKDLELKVRRWMYMNLKAGMKLRGVVRGMTDYAAFVDVGGGVTGFLKIEEISTVRVQKVSDKLKLGQRVECVVKKYDRDTGRIELSLKDAQPKFELRVKNLKEGAIVEGIVRVRNRNGLLVELKNDILALADHVSGIEIGQKVIVHVKKIQLEKEKIKVEIIG